jgi:hypothetical protein
VLSRVSVQRIPLGVDGFTYDLDVRHKRMALAVGQHVESIVSPRNEADIAVNGFRVRSDEAVLFLAIRQ